MEQLTYTGPGSAEQLPDVLKKWAPEKILLVRGKNSYTKCGAANIMERSKEVLACQLTEFCEFSENPQYEDVKKGLTLVRQFQPDVIIGIGGGSVMDMAKLLRFFYSYDYNEDFSRFDKKEGIIPLVVLPTTSGTGSESTHFAVVYRNKVKYSVAHADVLPDVAVADPRFTYSNPAYLTACSGFDALAQAVEAFWNVNATDESDRYACRAIPLLRSNLLAGVNHPSDKVRNKLSEGAFWAGKAINITKTTAPHAFSYPFTAYYGLPHGHAVAVTFPFFLQYNYPGPEKRLNPKLDASGYKEKMDKLYAMLNVNSVVTAFDDMTGFIRQLSLGFKCPENYAPQIILEHVNLQRLSNNPVIPDRELIRDFIFSLKTI